MFELQLYFIMFELQPTFSDKCPQCCYDLFMYIENVLKTLSKLK